MPSAVLGFTHRCNSDFTFDSICHRCFQTIATVQDEGELPTFELKHVCDPRLVKRFGPKIIEAKGACNNVQLGSFCIPDPMASAKHARPIEGAARCADRPRAETIAQKVTDELGVIRP